MTTIDQVLSSTSNALIVFTLAQASSANEFGIIALMVTVVAVCTGFIRGSLGTPLLLTSNLDDQQIAAESGYAVSWSLGIGVIAGMIIAAGGVVIDRPAVALAFAVSIPFALAQDVLRMTAIALERPGRAVASDALWAVIVLSIFVANLLGAAVSAPVTVYIWGVSGLASAILLAVWTGVSLRTHRIWGWWCTYWQARLRFGSLPASSQIGAFLVTAAAVATAGGAAAAGIRGAMTLFGPITMVVAALPMVFVPRAARTRHSVAARTQWRQLVKTSSITSGSTLLAAVCLLYVPTSLGSALLGETWDGTLQVVPYIGLQWAAMGWLISVYIFFQSQGVSRAVLWLNVVHMVLQVSTCAVAGLVFGSASAIGVALAVSGWSMAAVGMVLVQTWLRRNDTGLGAVGSTPAVDVAERMLAR